MPTNETAAIRAGEMSKRYRKNGGTVPVASSPTFDWRPRADAVRRGLITYDGGFHRDYFKGCASSSLVTRTRCPLFIDVRVTYPLQETTMLSLLPQTRCRTRCRRRSPLPLTAKQVAELIELIKNRRLAKATSSLT